MPVFDQGYRRYEGTLSRRSPILGMAWQNVRPRFRWWVWLVAFLLGFYPYLFWAAVFFFQLVIANAGVAPPTGPTGPAPELVAFSDEVAQNAIAFVMGPQSSAIWWEILKAGWLAAAVVPAVACGGIVASDRATGAMQIYFSRPISRIEYLAAKFLSVATFATLMTAIPTCLIWVLVAAMSSDPSYLIENFDVPFRIICASSFYVFWVSSLVLALSTLLPRPALATIGTVVVVLMLVGISAAITEATGERSWRLLNPYYALGGISAPLFGYELPEWLKSPLLFVPTLVVPTALLGYVWWRVRAVEVST